MRCRLPTQVNPVNLFGNVRYALFSAFIPVLWQGSGFAMVIFSAALQSLPLEIREASVIDGANKMRQIRSIVLPYIARTVIIVMTVNMIGGFKAFDLLKVLTAGGPASSTEITALYMYRIGFFLVSIRVLFGDCSHSVRVRLWFRARLHSSHRCALPAL